MLKGTSSGVMFGCIEVELGSMEAEGLLIDEAVTVSVTISYNSLIHLNPMHTSSTDKAPTSDKRTTVI